MNNEAVNREQRTIARGVHAIAEAIDEPDLRKTYYKLEKGYLPGAFKEGGTWCLSIPRWRRAVHGDAA